MPARTIPLIIALCFILPFSGCSCETDQPGPVDRGEEARLEVAAVDLGSPGATMNLRADYQGPGWEETTGVVEHGEEVMLIRDGGVGHLDAFLVEKQDGTRGWIDYGWLSKFKGQPNPNMVFRIPEGKAP